MDRVDQSSTSGRTRPYVRCAVWIRAAGIALIAIVAASGQSIAQKASPEILAEERSDPAAGETVIINRKKAKPKKNAKQNAPDPYAPIKLKPLPKKLAKPERAAKPKPERKAAIKVAPPAKPKRRAVVKVEPPTKPKLKAKPKTTAAVPKPVAPEALAVPPLPSFNKEPAPRTARLRQFTQPPSSSEQTERLDAPRSTPRQSTRQSTRQAKPRRQRRIARGDEFQRRDRYREPEVRYRRARRSRRPWRQCRRLAWRCQDGSERACYAWQRRCT